MGFALNVAVEDISGLTDENIRLNEAVEELTGLLYETDDSDDDDDDEETEEEKYERYMAAKKGKKEESYGYSSNLLEDVSLLDELRGIGRNDRTVSAVNKQSKLVEGFEQVNENCRDIVDRLIQVMAEDQNVQEAEDLVLEDDDPRVQLAVHFESIADDAESYLSRLSDGDVPFRMAEADLSKLYSDMEQGIDHMHSVE